MDCVCFALVHTLTLLQLHLYDLQWMVIWAIELLVGRLKQKGDVSCNFMLASHDADEPLPIPCSVFANLGSL